MYVGLNLQIVLNAFLYPAKYQNSTHSDPVYCIRYQIVQKNIHIPRLKYLYKTVFRYPSDPITCTETEKQKKFRNSVKDHHEPVRCLKYK